MTRFEKDVRTSRFKSSNDFFQFALKACTSAKAFSVTNEQRLVNAR